MSVVGAGVGVDFGNWGLSSIFGFVSVLTPVLVIGLVLGVGLELVLVFVVGVGVGTYVWCWCRSWR